MSFAALAAVVVIGVLAYARTPSDAAGGSSNAGGDGPRRRRHIGLLIASWSSAPTASTTRAPRRSRTKQQSTGVQYFAAAAKVYRAAWKQQATDPNVGTDYATSLFYSGDTDGALKQVDVGPGQEPGLPDSPPQQGRLPRDRLADGQRQRTDGQG